MKNIEINTILNMSDSEVIDLLTSEQQELLYKMYDPIWIFGDLYRDAAKYSGDDDYMNPREFFIYEYEVYLDRINNNYSL